jgi:Domain of unknown function (DUF4783)
MIYIYVKVFCVILTFQMKLITKIFSLLWCANILYFFNSYCINIFFKNKTTIKVKQIFLVLAIFFSVAMSGQSETAFFSALKSADVIAMEPYLEDVIDFCLFEDQQIMNKKAAMTKLKNFLSGHTIQSVEVMHKGASKDKSSQYKVAKITTSKNTFRVFVYAEGAIGTKTVKEIRIDNF